MSLLLPERPLQLLPQLAATIGLNEAIILQQVHWLCAETPFGIEFDGKRWIYNSPEGWQKWFPFFSERTIRRILENLRTMGLIKAEQLQGQMSPMFYRVSDSAPVILREGKLPVLSEEERDGQIGQAVGQNGRAGVAKLANPYIDKEISKDPLTPKGGMPKVKDNVPTSPEALAICRIIGRRPATPWEDKLIKSFRKLLPIDPQDLTVLEEYYVGAGKNPDNCLRRYIGTLLNNFSTEVDRARKWKTKPNGTHQKPTSSNPRCADTLNSDPSRYATGPGIIGGRRAPILERLPDPGPDAGGDPGPNGVAP